MSNVVVVLGPGLIGQAIARRVGVGRHVLSADVREENAVPAAETLSNAGYDVSVASRPDMAKGPVARTGPFGRSPDGIRTRATAVRGRRARPLHNGAVQHWW